MPELPEVETTRRGIEPLLRGERLTAVNVRERRLRWPVDVPPALCGQVLQSVTRRAKYLLLHFDDSVLMIHLGMSGSLRVLSATQPYLKHDHVELIFGAGRALRLNDPRRFGSVHWHAGSPETHWLLANLGVEPLGDDFSGAYLKIHARHRRVAVKNFLMDPRVVVGVGNIYANEALFLAGLRPTVRAGRVTRRDYVRLEETVRQVLTGAIDAGGTTLRDFVDQDGNPGYFKQSLNVYGRAGLPCVRCRTLLTGIRLGQRATVFCRNCQ